MTKLDYELTDFLMTWMVHGRVSFSESPFPIECIKAMIHKYGHDEYIQVGHELYKHHLREHNARCWDADRFVPYESVA